MTIYRITSEAEIDDLMTARRFRAGPNSSEDGKWFALSIDHAVRWGLQFEAWDGVPHRRLISVTLPDERVVDVDFRANHDGVGDAMFISNNVLNTLQFSVLQ